MAPTSFPIRNYYDFAGLHVSKLTQILSAYYCSTQAKTLQISKRIQNPFSAHSLSREVGWSAPWAYFHHSTWHLCIVFKQYCHVNVVFFQSSPMQWTYTKSTRWINTFMPGISLLPPHTWLQPHPDCWQAWGQHSYFAGYCLPTPRVCCMSTLTGISGFFYKLDCPLFISHYGCSPAVKL